MADGSRNESTHEGDDVAVVDHDSARSKNEGVVDDKNFENTFADAVKKDRSSGRFKTAIGISSYAKLYVPINGIRQTCSMQKNYAFFFTPSPIANCCANDKISSL